MKNQEQQKPVKIKATVMWAFLHKVNDMSGTYQVDLANLSPAAVDALQDLGIEAQRNEKYPEKGYFITAKSRYPIKAYDTEGEELKGIIGNGSKATAVIGAYEWTFKNKKGISPGIKKLVITDMVEFVAEQDSFDDEEGL